MKKLEDVLEILIIWGIALLAPFSVVMVVFADDINEFHSQDETVEETGHHYVDSLESHLVMCQGPDIDDRADCERTAHDTWN